MISSSRICAVVAAPHAAGMRKQLARALARTRLVELRLDWLSNDAEIARFLKWLSVQPKRKTTLIATCRRLVGGGHFKGSIAKQLFHVAEAIRAGCQWYDLETETASLCPPELLDVLLGDGRQLRSTHFFNNMPLNLSRVSADLRRDEPAAIKIAAHCDSLAEALELLRFARSERNIVAIPMGDVAMSVRLLAPRQGSALTYAPVENATAPGQVSLDEALNLYRADKVDRQTRVYGVIGDPVGHSLSPVMQNAGFQARRINAIYLPFLVRDLKDFIAAVQPLAIRGFSVTVPHKERIVRFLDDCDPLAEKIGAVNTVVVRRDGKLHGYNTDYVGVLRTLESRIPLRNSRILVLGSGGAARAVAFALAQAGASVLVCARRPGKAKALARAVGGQAIERKHLPSLSFDAIVNSTPVGMHPNVSQAPLDAKELNCSLVFDTIYRPRETKLLQLAARHGIQTVSGIDMFLAQGTAQWELWTGKRAPHQAMRRAVVRALDREEKMSGDSRPKKKSRLK
jgi:3-dehydroquinate dehydratase / shikimate dehydrogenase